MFENIPICSVFDCLSAEFSLIILNKRPGLCNFQGAANLIVADALQKPWYITFSILRLFLLSLIFTQYSSNHYGQLVWLEH